MNLNRSFVHRALAAMLMLAMVAACVPAKPTAPPNLNFGETQVAPPTADASAATPAGAAATPAASVPTTPTVPTATYTAPASDFSQMPDPLEGWQKGNPSAPIRLVEYGDFQ